jgi:hypothetical protein
MLKIVNTVLCIWALGLSAAVLAQTERAANQNQAPQTPAIEQPAASAHMQAVQASKKDVPAEMHNAIEQLNTAKADLEKAGGEWGGHKANAINHINEALREINLGVDWAHKNNTY